MGTNPILDGLHPAVKLPSENKTTNTNKIFGKDDLFVAVMGLTGSGKSTFISHCTEESVEVGHGLMSHTQSIQLFPCQYGDKKVHLIDTPGFDDTQRRDIDVLKDVTFWLKKSYNENIRLTGIIYLQSISGSRVGGTALRDLNMFKALCGSESFSSVVIGTTFWEETTVSVGDVREAQLQREEIFYAPMLERGATMMRHFNNKHSALAIISHLVNRGTTTVLHIQKELKSGKNLDQTDAGMTLEREITKVREESLKQLETSRRAMQAALEKQDQLLASRLAEQQDKLERKLQAKEREREELRIDMEKLFQEKEEQFKALKQQLLQQQEEKKEAIANQAKQTQEWQTLMKAAEQEYAARQKQQEDQIRRLIDEKNEAESLQKQQMFAKMNEQMEERLRLAMQEQEKRDLALSNAQAEMMKILLEQSRKPENYQGDPPSYKSATVQSSDSSNSDDVIAASLLMSAGAGLATGSLAPTLLPLAAVACTMM
ncbi:hypothetical protein KCU83_g1017, partial [Aureobasidium melanogenum]